VVEPSNPAKMTVTVTGIFEPCPECDAPVEISTVHGPLGMRTVGNELYLTPHTTTCRRESHDE
jgi:hypothetical protein